MAESLQRAFRVVPAVQADAFQKKCSCFITSLGTRNLASLTMSRIQGGSLWATCSNGRSGILSTGTKNSWLNENANNINMSEGSVESKFQINLVLNFNCLRWASKCHSDQLEIDRGHDVGENYGRGSDCEKFDNCDESLWWVSGISWRY